MFYRFVRSAFHSVDVPRPARWVAAQTCEPAGSTEGVVVAPTGRVTIPAEWRPR